MGVCNISLRELDVLFILTWLMVDYEWSLDILMAVSILGGVGGNCILAELGWGGHINFILLCVCACVCVWCVRERGRERVRGVWQGKRENHSIFCEAQEVISSLQFRRHCRR